MRYKLSIIQIGNKFIYVGSIPKELTIVKLNNESLTDTEFREYIFSSNPAMIKKLRGYKELVFDSRLEALEHAKSKGYQIVT